jgi:hypothetical protein
MKMCRVRGYSAIHSWERANGTQWIGGLGTPELVWTRCKIEQSLVLPGTKSRFPCRSATKLTELLHFI